MTCQFQSNLKYLLGQCAVAESVEPGPRVGEMGCLVSGRVKAMTYEKDTCCFLAKCAALLTKGKNWLDQWQDNVTEWYSRMWYCQPGVSVWQYYKVTNNKHCTSQYLS